MNQTKYLKGECSHCRGHIEFPAEQTGMVADCPHCGQQTELLLPVPPDEPTVPAKTIIWTSIAIIILLCLLGFAFVGLHMMQKRMNVRTPAPPSQASEPASNAPPQEPENPATKAGFGIGAIIFDKSSGSSLVYATGILSNPTEKQRFGIKVELELLDAAGQKIGIATDYRQVMEPHSEWQFKAMVVSSKATSARLASIVEQQ